MKSRILQATGSAARRTGAFLRDRYLSVDARSLGLFRIVFGLHLIVNLYDRTRGPDGVAFYTNDGLLPNHYALFAPLGDKIWSLLFPFSTPDEVQVAFFLILGVYLFYVLGYRTKVTQILAVVCLVSLDNRNLILQNGGIVVTNVVAVWTAFLPLGARFSLDHLLRSLRKRRESTPAELADRSKMIRSPHRFVRIAFFGLLVNFACIYFFNFAHKRGVTWRDGSAVHWVLWQNRIATIGAAWLRMHEPAWLSPLSTYATLGLEAALPVLLLSPIAPRWTRRLAILAIWLLHGSIAATMTLGPFSYSMMSFSLLLIGKDDWELAARFWRRRPSLAVLYDPASIFHRELARLLARLDSRTRLAFANIAEDAPAGLDANTGEASAVSAPADANIRAGTPAPADANIRSSAPAPLFAVREIGTFSFHTGAAALARALGALPFGFAGAFWLRLPFVRERVDRALQKKWSLSAPEVHIESPASAFLRSAKVAIGQVLAFGFLVTVLVEVGSDNWIIPDKYRVKHRPELMGEIVEYLRLPQGWSMFSPEAPRDDGTIVIDAVLSDGRHIDPRKQRPPDFDAAFHGPWFDDQQWCDWDLRMRADSSRHLYPYFREYIARLDRMRSWKQGASIQYFDVYWVNNAAPPRGSTRPYDIRRQLLFSGGARP